LNRGLATFATTVGAAAAAAFVLGAARANDDGFASFWKVFAPAMAKDDRAALAGMVGPAIGSFADFHAQYLTGAVRRCIATGRPVPQLDGRGVSTYYVRCDQTDYVFYKEAGVWKLDDMELDD
jgi:hypothetical protein